MKLKLSEHFAEKLLKHKESGMGYQVVDVVLKSKERINALIVLNGEYLMLPEDRKDLKVEDIEDVIARGEEA